MEYIEIEILQWQKHQRKDVKRPSWFALSNRILEDSKLFDLTDGEWKALIYIFSQASQQQSENVRLNYNHAKRVCGITEKTLNSAISRLNHAGVTRTSRERNADVTPHYKTRQDKTEQDKTNTPTEVGFVPDFLKVYQEYPRKDGKKAGLKICEREIKTHSAYEDLLLAVKKYRDHHKHLGTEKQFLKHFSTFMGEWRDWLDPNHGTADDFGEKAQSDEFWKSLEGA